MMNLLWYGGVFSDKTGTLTENRMTFAKCSIRGNVHDVDESEAIYEAWSKAPELENRHRRRAKIQKRKKSKHKAQELVATKSEIKDFLLCLGLCHTLIIEQNDDDEPLNIEKSSKKNQKRLQTRISSIRVIQDNLQMKLLWVKQQHAMESALRVETNRRW